MDFSEALPNAECTHCGEAIDLSELDHHESLCIEQLRKRHMSLAMHEIGREETKERSTWKKLSKTDTANVTATEVSS
jgi:hypothetical protein